MKLSDCFKEHEKNHGNDEEELDDHEDDNGEDLLHGEESDDEESVACAICKLFFLSNPNFKDNASEY